MSSLSPLLTFDRKLLKTQGGIIGIDEAGRGALAGPVVAAAAWLSKEFYEKASRLKNIHAVRDSKQLSPEKRENAFQLIESWTNRGLIKFFWAEGSVKEIEDYNILGASRLAMQRAFESLMLTIPESFRVSKISGMPLWDSLSTQNTEAQALVLVDGLPLKPFDYPHHAIIEGDASSLAIAMASIVAKVQRDYLMIELGKQYTAYGLEDHKGYGTDTHREAILKQGPADIHRLLFLRKVLG